MSQPPAKPDHEAHYAALKEQRSARSLVMKWALATVALQDLITVDPKRPPSWLDVAGAASRWVDDYGQRTGRWKGTAGAALHLSTMDASPSAPPPPDELGWFDRLDRFIALSMQRYGILLLRISLGVVFLWFGALKPFGLSPANELVTRTITFIPPRIFIPTLGVWEMLIGLCLLIRPLMRVALLLLFVQMAGTVLPLFLLPDVCYTHIPYGLTLEGQYIVKNLCLISAAIVVGGTVRHGLRRRQQERVTLLL
jgi:uncharacterized membrane protein YkgB